VVSSERKESVPDRKRGSLRGEIGLEGRHNDLIKAQLLPRTEKRGTKGGVVLLHEPRPSPEREGRRSLLQEDKNLGGIKGLRDYQSKNSSPSYFRRKKKKNLLQLIRKGRVNLWWGNAGVEPRIHPNEKKGFYFTGKKGTTPSVLQRKGGKSGEHQGGRQINGG